jgi:pimeloyl-ACP methyl ester carboxylesterase
MNAGSRFVSLRDGAQEFRAWVVYPTEAEEHETALGPYTASVASEAPYAIAQSIVAFSHGSGSSPFLFRELVRYLARAGHTCVLVEHPGNHRQSNELAESDLNLVQRPRHLQMAIDAVAVADVPIALVGQSMGAYTALALAGGKPVARNGASLDVVHDARVGAIVLLTPAIFWYVPEGALREVNADISIYVGGEDVLTPTWHGHLVRESVADKSKVTMRVVEHAGHLSLLSPLPAGAPWRDPPQFDRAAVHAEMRAEIEEFIRRDRPRTR